MAMSNTLTIGQIINPSWSYNLEASLRVHRMLLSRAMIPRWRFRGPYVVTGPFETLCGYSGCGTHYGGTSWCSLRLHVADGLEKIVRRTNDLILRAMCEFSGFAQLDETLNVPFVNCRSMVDALGKFELSRTRRALNKCHNRARVVRNVAIVSREDGVYMDADVTLGGSRWGLFWLHGSKSPKWNERLKLATWLSQCEGVLSQLIDV